MLKKKKEIRNNNKYSSDRKKIDNVMMHFHDKSLYGLYDSFQIDVSISMDKINYLDLRLFAA